ncbi:MAG: hypothetical protein LBH51_04540 [Treponema sp.]|jgi:hypothetical protein|nr:hypothetical protein [Treponema sp.]
MKGTKHPPRTALGTAALLAAAVFSGGLLCSCEKLDVVGAGSLRSLEQILPRLPRPVSRDEAAGGWSLAAPDNSVRFIWSADFAESPRYDLFFEFDAAPFIAAGLDPRKLPDHYGFADEKITVGTKLGRERFSYPGDATPLESYRQILKLKRDSIGYHMAMDHYGISLGDGNLFEWAKDAAANDMDIVFALNPAPLAGAGADPARIPGWTFTTVPADDEKGRPVRVEKLLKAFNL